MKIGILNEEMSTGLEVLFLEAGHHVCRHVPGYRVSRETDYLNYYHKQISYADSAVDIARGADFCIVDPNYPTVFSKLQYMGVPVIGTSPIAYELENDRIFAKRVAKRAGIKAPKSWVVTNLEQAKDVLRKNKGNLVMKPGDHIAASENLRTIVPSTPWDLETILETIDYFKEGGSVILEQRIQGVEVAFSALFDGHDFVLPYTVNTEYKPTAYNDRGILCGEAGTVLFHCYDTSLAGWALLQSFAPLLRSDHYCGMFDVNTILTPKGNFYLLEFTPRFGFPTLEEMVATYKDDLAEVLLEVACCGINALKGKQEKFGNFTFSASEDWIVSVCAMTHGIPLTIDMFVTEEDPDRGLDFLIDGIPRARELADVRMLDVKVLEKDHGKVRSGWGDRSLVVNGVGETLIGAKERAYRAINEINYWSMTYRSDIGYRMVNDCRQLLEHNVISQDRYDSVVL